MRIGSLFSGYGGLDLAVEQVTGATPAWFVEHEAAPSRILAHHWPDVPNLGDVTTVDWTRVEPVDVITGGYPCQPFSVAGKRRGAADERHLWPYVVEAISALRPEWCLFENVRGHLTLGFDQVLRDLSVLQYEARWIVLRAADVGAPHGRARLFIVAERERGAVPSAQPVAELRDGQWWQPVDGLFGPVPFAGRIPPAGRMVNGRVYEVPLPESIVDAILLPTPVLNDMGLGKTVAAWDEWTAKMKARHGNGNGHGASLAVELQRVAPGWGPYASAVKRWESVLDRPAPVPSDDLLVREWLMGLPDGWVTGVPDVTRNHALKALGNGVVPQQAAAALTHLLGVASVEEVAS